MLELQLVNIEQLQLQNSCNAMSCPSVKDYVAYQWIKHSNIAFITSNGNTMVPLHLLTSSTCYSDMPWLIIPKSIGSRYSYATYSSGQ